MFNLQILTNHSNVVLGLVLAISIIVIAVTIHYGILKHPKYYTGFIILTLVSASITVLAGCKLFSKLCYGTPVKPLELEPNISAPLVPPPTFP